MESVFLALVENVVVFKAEGKADNTHFLVLFIAKGVLYAFVYIHTKCEE